MILQYIFVISLFLTPTLGNFMKLRDCPADAVEKPPQGNKIVLHTVFIEECIEDPCVLIQGSDMTISINATTMYKASRIKFSIALRVAPLYIPLTLEEDIDLCEFIVKGNCKNVNVGENYVAKRKVKPPQVGLNVEAQMRAFLKDDKNAFTFCGEFGFLVKEKAFAFGSVLAPTLKPAYPK